MHHLECKIPLSAELIVVEGKHAANAVNRVRDRDNQSVLAMQGKVPNVVKGNLQRQITENDHVRYIVDVLKSWAEPGEVKAHRYRQVVILSDPDADGLHAAMLLTCLLAKVFPGLVVEEGLLLCLCPLFAIAANGEEEIAVYSVQELDRYRQQSGNIQVQRFKGIASLPAELLRRTCISTESRKANLLTEADCLAIKNRLA